jgi:hypothetical protein
VSCLPKPLARPSQLGPDFLFDGRTLGEQFLNLLHEFFMLSGNLEMLGAKDFEMVGQGFEFVWVLRALR